MVIVGALQYRHIIGTWPALEIIAMIILSRLMLARGGGGDGGVRRATSTYAPSPWQIPIVDTLSNEAFDCCVSATLGYQGVRGAVLRPITRGGGVRCKPFASMTIIPNELSPRSAIISAHELIGACPSCIHCRCFQSNSLTIPFLLASLFLPSTDHGLPWPWSESLPLQASSPSYIGSYQFLRTFDVIGRSCKNWLPLTTASSKGSYYG